MDFRIMETFLKVSELHSFSQAARELGYSQSAVSTQIARLEQELGSHLFDRIGHQITLTEKGHSFLQYAQQVTLLTEQMLQAVVQNTETTGTLRIAMADSLCSAGISDILLDYQEHYPKVLMEIRTGVTKDLFNWLSHNEVDMVYTLDNRITRPDLIVLLEEEEIACFYAAADHPLTNQKKVHWEDLNKYPLYMTESGISYRNNLELFLGKTGIRLVPTLELGNTQVIRRLIERGRGIGFLPAFTVKEALIQGQICAVLLEGLPVSVWKQLIYHRGKFVTPAMEGFISLLYKNAPSS